MSWIQPQNRKLRHTLTLLCAMCLAVAATWASHRWIERRNAPRLFEGYIGTVYLHSLLNIPVRYPGLEPFDLEGRPLYAAFCRRVAQRAKLYMLDSSAEYDVALVGMYWCQGFPLISKDWNARVEVYGNGGKSILFFAGQDGNSPILYGGLIGNWLFYLVISAALLYAAEKAVIAFIIRRRQRRHGFPVVMDNEEGT